MYIIETLTYQVPSNLLSALINEDFSGLTNEETAELREWIGKELKGVKECHLNLHSTVWDSQDSGTFYTRYHDYNGDMLCECSGVALIIYGNNNQPVKQSQDGW